MDRETVRLVLLIIGVIVIAAIYLHGRFGSALRRSRRSSDGLGELPADWSGGAGTTTEAWSSDAGGYDDAADDERGEGQDESAPSTVPRVNARLTQDNAVGAPFLIQASVVARRGETFSGEELRDALLDLGLVHGEMDIFHRYDRSFREPMFSVASLVKPGTFPMDNMEAFDCPGVVLFFQPTKVPDPLAVFDDLFETSRDLAEKLDGIEWDEHREPLTEESVRALRERVEAACA